MSSPRLFHHPKPWSSSIIFITVISYGQPSFNRFECCCIDPITAISLCWLVEDYVVADAIASSLTKQKLSLPILLQADWLLQLLDSPIYLHLRLHLVDSHYPHYPALVGSVYKFLIGIPQSESSVHFKDRLMNLQALYLVLRRVPEKIEMSEEDVKRVQLYQSKHNLWTVCWIPIPFFESLESSEVFEFDI